MLGGLAQRWVEAADAEPRQGRLHAIDQPGPFTDEVFPFPRRALGVLVLDTRHDRHGAMPRLTTQPTEEYTHEQRRIQAIGLGAAAVTRHRDTASVDHVRLDAARPQPARQPEAVAPGLISHHDAGDRSAGLGRLLAPAFD